MSGQEDAFVTIAANGMQQNSDSSSPDSVETSITTPSSGTHDTSRSVYHLKDITEFAAQLDQAAQGVFPNRDHSQPRYNNVQVVLIRWDDDNRLGVSCELEDLCKVFKHSYGFETTTWLIPTEDPLEDIMGKALGLTKEVAKEGKLLIVYYAGHAAMNEARQQVWYRTGRRKDECLEWFAIQPLFLKSKTDVLFLLDCCAAASASAATASQNIIGTKETIAACGFEAQAPEPGAHSFTCELIEVLDKWKYSAPFSVAMLHSELLANLRHPKPKKDMFGKLVESRRTPVYVVTTSNAKTISIELARRHSELADCKDFSRPQKRQKVSHGPFNSNIEGLMESSTVIPPAYDSSFDGDHPKGPENDKYAQDQLNRVLPQDDFSIPHVLISLALEGEQLLETGAWNKWLSDCPAFAKYARIEGMYKSHSTLLLISVAVAVWDLLPENPACSFIGYVNSTNQIREQTWQDTEDLESWLRKKEEWKNCPGLVPSEGSGSDWNTDIDLPIEAQDTNIHFPRSFPTPVQTLSNPSIAEPKLERFFMAPAKISNGAPQATQDLHMPLSSIRPSSGAWNPHDDATLIAARAQGMDWAPIQSSYFPWKTPNACRKRHERLMERRAADNWDVQKLEEVAKCYMTMRREIWEGLAKATGSKWMVVEQKCMSTGLKNLQTASRAYNRRERISSNSGNTWIDLEGDGATRNPDTQTTRGKRTVGNSIGLIARGNDNDSAIGLVDGRDDLSTNRQARDYSGEGESSIM